jgi:hypothetical protein
MALEDDLQVSLGTGGGGLRALAPLHSGSPNPRREGLEWGG